MVRTVAVGVIGMGWMGDAHSRAYRLVGDRFHERGIDARLVACADVDRGRAEAAQARYGFERSTTDWHDVVADPAIEAISVTAPNDTHLAVIRAAVERGLHILCEKPVGRTPEETLEAAGLARGRGLITFVGYNYRWAPVVQHAHALIAGGAIGEPTHYRGRFLNGYAKDPDGVLSWRFRGEQGYGTLSDLLSHAIDMAHLVCGPIAEVTGNRATIIAERPLPSPAGRTTTRRAPTPRAAGHERGLRRRAGPVRERRAGHARGLPRDHGLAVRPRLRDPRHARRDRLDVRADERAARLPARRRRRRPTRAGRSS